MRPHILNDNDLQMVKALLFFMKRDLDVYLKTISRIELKIQEMERSIDDYTINSYGDDNWQTPQN